MGMSAAARNFQAFIAMIRGDYVQALRQYRGVLAIAVELNNKFLLMETLSYLGLVAWAQKDYEQAAFHSKEALALEDVQDFSWISPEYVLGLVALSQREYLEAKAHLKKIISSLDKISASSYRNIRLFLAINALGVLAVEQKQTQRAARLFGVLDTRFGLMKNTLSLAARDQYEQALADARAALGDDAFTAAWEAGRAMSLEQAVQYALEETKER